MWPLVDAPIVNTHFETLDDLDVALAERRRTLARHRTFIARTHQLVLAAQDGAHAVINRIRCQCRYGACSGGSLVASSIQAISGIAGQWLAR